MTEPPPQVPHDHAAAHGREVPLLPLAILVVVCAVLAPALAAWGEAGGPEAGTLESAAYALAAFAGWPVVVLGPATLAAVMSRRRGRTGASTALWFATWAVVTWCAVGLGLLSAFAVACGGTCMS